MGDGGAEPLSAIGDGGQASISFTPDIHGTGSDSWLDSILSTFLKKRSGGIWVVTFFLIMGDMVALICILNGCCNLHVLFCVWVLASKSNSAPSNKESPLAVSCVMNFFGSLVTSPSSCLSSSFLWASSSIRSSLVSFTFACLQLEGSQVGDLL